MNLSIHPSSREADTAAAECLGKWLTATTTRNVMLAAGNTPIELYRGVAERRLNLSHLNIFALDEYVGVPLEEPRNCANLIGRIAAQPWGIPGTQFHTISSLERDALASIREHEAKIHDAGGLDVLVLGLGQNGHLGFNEPGSQGDSSARLLDLAPISVAANRKWFGGDYAPAKGATVGMKTILAARHILIMAYGPHKSAAVRAMVRGPRGPQCPASFLQAHSDTQVFLDKAAASELGES